MWSSAAQGFFTVTSERISNALWSTEGTLKGSSSDNFADLIEFALLGSEAGYSFGGPAEAGDYFGAIEPGNSWAYAISLSSKGPAGSLPSSLFFDSSLKLLNSLYYSSKSAVLLIKDLWAGLLTDAWIYKNLSS